MKSGDLYNEEQILNWLLTQKDPSGEVIEALEGDDLLRLIHNSDSLAVYFCELSNISIFLILNLIYKILFTKYFDF